jgi:hypothetical protein
MGKWQDRDFESSSNPKSNAVHADDVGWMVVEWSIRRDENRCPECGGNYSLTADQFEDMRLATTRRQAIRRFRRFKRNRRQNVPEREDAPVRTTLFLTRIVKVALITDDWRVLLPDIEQNVEEEMAETWEVDGGLYALTGIDSG